MELNEVSLNLFYLSPDRSFSSAGAERDSPAGERTPFVDDSRRRFEQDYLAQLLKITSGNVSKAARLAKRNRTEFYKLLQRHHLDPSLFKQPKL